MDIGQTCTHEDCTFAETGTCLLEKDAESCPHREASSNDAGLIESGQGLRQEPESKEGQAVFPPSWALTASSAHKIMGGRYYQIIGILGAPDAGKTAALVSLFLLMSRNRLIEFTYSDSRTLMAFHEISCGARRWNQGKPPEQFTTHTVSENERTAGFLHIRLLPQGVDQPVDLLISDLPGEWTIDLIDRNRLDRFEYLRRADVVWLMIDGQQLCETTTRHLAVHRMKLLFQRLADILLRETSVILVITRRDICEADQSTIDLLRDHAREAGLDLKVVAVASFSESDDIVPGFGISELITKSLQVPNAPPTFWPDPDQPIADRAPSAAIG